METELEQRIGDLEWEVFGMDRIAPETAQKVEKIYKTAKNERTEKLKEIIESYKKVGLIRY